MQFIPPNDRVPADLSRFFVITVISNPQRFRRRYELYHKFRDMVAATGVRMITVEQAFGERNFMVTEPDNRHHVQVRGVDEIWLKENLINVGAQRAAELGAREIAWIDADCFPMSPMREWFDETWHELQHYEFVQMWKSLLNFGPNYEVIGEAQPSFIYFYEAHGFTVPKNWGKTTDGKVMSIAGSDYAPGLFRSSAGFKQDQFGRPGLAWAANVDAFNKVGGLIDFCILGSGDWHMAHALVGAMTEQTTLVGTLQGHGSQEFKNPTYTHALLAWQEKCERWIKRDVGFVDMTVGHWWHGKYKDRKYGSRGKILTENDYNPYTDIKKDIYGIIQLETHDARQIRLRDQCRLYFQERNEDSVDIY